MYRYIDGLSKTGVVLALVVTSTDRRKSISPPGARD